MGIISVNVDIDVDDVLSDLTDADLVQEMENRNITVDGSVGHAVYLNDWEASNLRSALALGDDAEVGRIMKGRSIDPVAPVAPITTRALQEAAKKTAEENRAKQKGIR